MAKKVLTTRRQSPLDLAMPTFAAVQSLAKAVQCSPTHLINVRNGRKVPSLQLARRLSDHLGVPLERLFP